MIIKMILLTTIYVLILVQLSIMTPPSEERMREQRHELKRKENHKKEKENE